jgi:polysaccharide pyruvyl transferase WcaK-like protein
MIRYTKRKKRVLLVGDVGRRGDGYYHVGDEAAVYQNYSLYHSAGDFDVSLFSWTLTHGYMDVGEYHYWEMPTGQNGWQRILDLVGQARRWKRFPFLKYQEDLKNHLELVREHDLVHISGGGNLNSYFPIQLYARALLMLLAGVLDKPILVTGQTIGPLADSADHAAARRALDAAHVITVRDRDFSMAWLKELGVCHPQVHVGLDDAFFLEAAPSSALESFGLREKPGRAPLRVGVSVHSGDEDARLLGALAQALDELARRIPIEVYFIPHVIVNQDARHDVPFMHGISTRLRAEVPQRAITSQDLMEHPEPVKERLVKALTGAMDLVIATRYHALVFAIGSGVPVLALFGGEYQRAKSLGLLEIVFEDRARDYAVDVSQDFSEELVYRLGCVIDRRERIHETLVDKCRSWSGRADFNLRLARELLSADLRRTRQA